ncbi:MAG: TonB-dependent receptor [Salinivirgaceae bacterium]|nr:MAG: TonB-dependent receptor [Salinivirgaceae bacterium]
MKKNLLTLVMLFIAASTFAQVSVTGVIIDADNGEPLIGATIFVEETSEGTFTLLNGEFDMPLEKKGEYNLRLSYIGYITKNMKVSANGDVDLCTIELEANSVGLNEVKVVADVAIGRETPVAVSTISIRQIQEKLGNQEFPEIMKAAPSTYVTKTGGGFGDSRINIRGFDARNTATLINGVPVNDMENGWVYWSNWAGLNDVTRIIQVQRGLGASKLALPSLGGTINIMTKTSDMERGGNAYLYTGNDSYLNYGVTLSTGQDENGWASTVALAKTNGNTFVDGSEFESYSYYISLSKRLNDKHSFLFSIFGAPQTHGQRRTMLSIEDYQNNKRGIRYNRDWGYKAGEVYNLNTNFYHKPQAIFNHFWTIDEKTFVNTSIYGSIGTGGGTGGYGNTDKFSGSYLLDGQINFDRIVEENIAAGAAGAETIMRSSNNNHSWWGILSTYKKELNDNIKIQAGIDGRYYKGEHYREVTDLLGGQFYYEEGVDVNKPYKIVKEGDKIAYHNDGLVSWGGGYLTGEYSTGNLDAYIATSASLKSYKRVDYFNYFSDNLIDKINKDAALEAQYLADLGESDFNRAMEGTDSEWVNFFGYVIKAGANYNLTETMNLFLNTGYFERQPDFDAIFLNYINNVNDEAENEKVFNIELGYGFQNKYIKASASLYHTLWLDKTLTQSYATEVDGFTTFYNANILGVDAKHQGIEFELQAQPTSKFWIHASATIGNWRWNNNVEGVDIYDDDQVYQETIDVYVKDVHVGDAAQTKFFLGLSYEILPKLKFGLDFYHNDNLYANFEPADRGEDSQIDGENPDSWKLPDYQLFDANISYDFKVNKLDATFYAHFYNLFDAEYVSEAEDGSGHDWQSASVYYGFGRTWSMGLKIRF